MTTQSGPARRIQAGAVRLAFRTWGTARAPGRRPPPGAVLPPPLVLLHAVGEDSADWEGVAAALAPSWRVHAPDLRGHGASDWAGPYTVEQLTSDLEAFLDALGLRRVALAGYSIGAAPAYLFAARHPDRVTRLILEEPAQPFPRPPVSQPPDSQPPDSQPPAFRERPEEPLGFDWHATALGDEFADPPPSWRAALSDIKAPTLLVAGGEDRHPGTGRLAEMAGLIPDCQLVTIEAGDRVHATRPGEFTSAVTAFLRESQA